MKENKVSGKSLIVVTLSLMIGTVIVLTLMVLNRKDASPPASTAAAPEVPAPHMLNFTQIREWILKEMAVKGAKLSVVNIWATWCEPCRAEMPELAKFGRTGNAPLFLVSADNESDVESVRAFLGDNKVNFQTSLIAGAQDEFIADWQKLTGSLKTPWSMTLPATFLVTDTGEIRAMLNGETTEIELKAFVAKHQDAKR